MTEVRLALGGPPEACAKGLAVRPGPSILVSYFYIEQAFNRYRERLVFRDWGMDSVAYSAHNSGGALYLDAYIEECKKREDDPQLTEVFALDVIGDYKASLVNTERSVKDAPLLLGDISRCCCNCRVMLAGRVCVDKRRA